jgi:hypothetical protein
MRPIAVVGALITLGVALFVVSKLTAPTSAVNQPVVEPPKPADTPKVEEKKEGDSELAPEEPPAEDFTHPSNPFDLKLPGPHPKAVIEQSLFEFGSMPLGSTRSHTFVIKNEGQAPLQLVKGPLQCKCTMPALKDKEIPPGGKAEIVLEWKPLAVQQEFQKEAIIWTNDPANSRIALQISGDVVTEDFWEPGESFNVGQMRQGETKTLTGYIMSKVRDDLKIERVDQASNSLQIEHQPADEALLKEKEAKSGYVFKITVPPSEEVTLIRDTVTVTVNSATNTHIIWQVFGSRVGPLSIVGLGWYADKQLFQLGHFRAAEGMEKKFSLFLTDRADQDLAITDVKVDGPIKFTLVKDEKWMNKANDRYYLTVKFEPGGPIGQQTPERPLPVQISTNHPRVPTINFNVSYDAD